MPDEPDIPAVPPDPPPQPLDVPPATPDVSPVPLDLPPAAEPAGRPGPPAQPPTREMLAAGFTHGDHEDGARGFAAEGPLDQMAPGPALAGFAGEAWDGGLAVLSDDELIGVLPAARRIASWASALELTAVAGLVSRRAMDARAAGDKRLAEHGGGEVAAARTATAPARTTRTERTPAQGTSRAGRDPVAAPVRQDQGQRGDLAGRHFRPG